MIKFKTPVLFPMKDRLIYGSSFFFVIHNVHELQTVENGPVLLAHPAYSTQRPVSF